MYLDKCNDKNNNKYNNENNNKCTNKIIQNFIIIFQLLKKINATRTTRFLNKHFKCLLPYYLYIFLNSIYRVKYNTYKTYICDILKLLCTWCHGLCINSKKMLSKCYVQVFNQLCTGCTAEAARL